MTAPDAIATITAIATAVYATILFRDRWTDKPRLEIKNVIFTKVGDKPNIEVDVVNKGRRTAYNVKGVLKAMNESGKFVKLRHPITGRSENEIAMFWDPYGIWTPREIHGKIGKDDVNLKLPTKPFEEKTLANISPGDWNKLKLTLPEYGLQNNIFEGLGEGEYKLEIVVFSGKTSAKYKGTIQYPQTSEN
jgi:hypothetical protein